MVIMEGVLRLFGYVPYYLDRNAFVPSKNSEILYELRPRFTGLYAGAHVAINPQGFRGKDVSIQPAPNVFRIVTIGDSVAFGQGVGDSETLPKQLEAMLASKLDSHIQVVNLGVPGYDTCQEFWTFKNRALPLHPKAALLVYVENDTDPAVFQIKDGDVVTPDVRTGLYGDFMAALRKYSRIYNFVWSRWQVVKGGRLSVQQYAERLERKFNDDSPGWIKSRECLSRLVELAQAASIRVVVMPFPVLSGVDEKPYPFRAYVKKVCEAARAKGAECIDVLSDVQGIRTRLRVSSVEFHPSAEVYRRIAYHLRQIFP